MRRILHVDMDSFYASVEQRDDPSLRGKPVAVGSASRRGVVAAASYEARPFGVRSAMPMARALALCPKLVVVPPRFEKYQEASEAVFAIFHEVTPLVEPLSLDEAFLDVTENAWGEKLGRDVAKRIKARIKDETRLTASAGVAPNKLLAKIASGWKKPDGLTVISPERAFDFLAALPADALWGVGPKTAERLASIGITKVAHLRTADPAALAAVLGSFAPTLVELANGIDERPVVPHRERKSIGSEETYENDLVSLGEMRERIASQARELARWLGENARAARTVTIKVRYEDFETVTRSDTRRPASSSPDEIAARAVALLERTKAATRPVRLLGVSLHGLEGPDEKTGEERQLVFPFVDERGSS